METDFRKQNLQVVETLPNGYCFLNSVLTCLLRDYGDTLTLEHCITKIVSHLCQNHQLYSAFHESSCTKYAADQLISDALDFFRNGQFLADVVDLLMQITADALLLNLFIYQRNGESIQVLNFKHPEADRIVRVKFTHDDKFPGGNHYDAIVRINTPPHNLQILIEAANRVEKLAPHNTQQDIIDLTISDEEHVTPNSDIINLNVEVKQELTEISSDEDLLSIHMNENMPPPTTLAKIDQGQETSYSGTTEMYSHSDETYVSSDQTDLEPNSSPASTPELPRRNRFTNYRGPNSTVISSSTTSSSLSDHAVEDDCFAQSQLEPNVLLKSICRGRPFPTWYFCNHTPQDVESIPPDIDGTQIFHVQCTKSDWLMRTRDLRHFTMVTSSREGFAGDRRIGTCQGSFVCRNDQCPFVQTSPGSVPNKVSWRYIKSRKNIRICNICDQAAEREGCGARKLIEFDYVTEVATVYHLGYHSCSVQVDIAKRNLLLKRRLQETKTTGSAKEIGLHEVSSLIESGRMDMAATEAENWVDRRATKRQMEKLSPTAGHDHNSFDAVGLIKRTTDTRDKYYIFRIGNKNLNGESDYVFKSSKKMGEIAWHMDVDGPDNILQLENAYFDATHTRVYGFKTLAMWTVHPAMKQILRLASMELRSENHTDVAIFLRLFNEMLAEITGIPGYKFNPRYFVCDEGGANYKAIREVYGEQFVKTRVKGCQWHFKSDVRKHLPKIGPSHRERFEEICTEMCNVTVIATFNTLLAELKCIAQLYPELKPFVKYWELRKSHVFAPFRGGGLPGLNMSEPGNASFKPPSTMRLVHAAKYDVSSMILQESEINMFERNLLPCSGRAPTKEKRDARDRAQQIRVAEDFANIFSNEADVISEAREGIQPASYLPGSNSKHRAPQRKKPVKQKKTAVTKEATDVTDAQLTQQCVKAMGIMDSEVSPESKGNKIDNPPNNCQGHRYDSSVQRLQR